MNVRDFFSKAGFPIPEGEPLVYTNNCGYWEGWPESDDSPMCWWLGNSQVPFLMGKWNYEATEGGMMMSYDGNIMDQSDIRLWKAAAYLPEELKAFAATLGF